MDGVPTDGLPEIVRAVLDRDDQEAEGSDKVSGELEDGLEEGDDGIDWDERSLPDAVDKAECNGGVGDEVLEEEEFPNWEFHSAVGAMAPSCATKAGESVETTSSVPASIFSSSPSNSDAPRSSRAAQSVSAAQAMSATPSTAVASTAPTTPTAPAAPTQTRAPLLPAATTLPTAPSPAASQNLPAAMTSATAPETPFAAQAGPTETTSAGRSGHSRCPAPPRPRAGGANPVRWSLPKYLRWFKARILFKNFFLVGLKTFSVPAPDPVATHRVLCPEDHLLPRIIVYSPFDIRGPYRPFCPSCGSDAVTLDGWSPFRRVIDMEECVFVVSRRYRCAKKHKDHCFPAWHAKLLEKAPPYVKLTFPVVFTHRLGVTQMVFDAMRTWTESGAGFGPFAEFIRENHTRRHHRKELAYLSRLTDVMEDSPCGDSRVSGCSADVAANFPRFPEFSESTGSSGCHGSKNFFRSVYTRGMEKLAVLMRKRCAMVPARMLSGDHFFKIIKCHFTFNGKQLFMAAYSLVNEHTQVMATILTQSKSLEELRQMLMSVQQRTIALGLPALQIDVFFTDNPTAEASFLEGVYPGLRKTSVSLSPSAVPTKPMLVFPGSHVVHYITSIDEANTAIDLMLEEVGGEGGCRVVGLDAEWNLDGGLHGRKGGAVRVVQVSSPSETLIVHLSRMSSFPHRLKALLANPAIVKAGKSIGGDIKKLLVEHGAASASTVELGTFAKSRQLVGNATIGLAGLVSVLLKKTLDKDSEVRLSNWSRPLSVEQQKYAALDSYASLVVYQHILQSSSPVPAPTSSLQAMELLVTDSSGSRRVAVCVIADEQPAKNGRFTVGAKARVWVRVVRVLVPSFILPFASKRQPSTLAALVQRSETIGTEPVFVVARVHLRDASHPIEKRLADQRAEAAHPVPPVPRGDGAMDALADLQEPIDHMHNLGVVPGVGSQAVGGGGVAGDHDDDGGTWGGAGMAAEARDDGLLDEAEVQDGEEDNGGPAVPRGLTSGVKGDIMHLMDRVLRRVPKNHGATALFSRCFSHALMFYNSADAEAARNVAAEKWPGMTWREVLYRQADWVNRRVRRTVPAPKVIVPRLEKLFADFGKIVDASTKQPLFNEATWKAARHVIQTAKGGWVTDPVGAPLYVLRRRDQDNLPLWLCSRGTNSNEGSVHQKLVKNFLGMKGASAELISYSLLEWTLRHNERAMRNTPSGPTNIGHSDVWILDDILKLREHIFKSRLSHFSHLLAADFDLPEFYCGVTTLSPDVLEDCGLPEAAMLSQISPLLPKLSTQKRYLTKAMGTNVPLLPVHTKEEKILYQDVMRRLRHDLRRAPSATEMTVDFNRVVADDWLRRAEQLASVKDRKRYGFKQPTLWFKSQSHMLLYQSFYERSQNVTSTILLSHPDKSRTTIAGSNVSTIDFGAAAMDISPVSGRPPPRQPRRGRRQPALTRPTTPMASPSAASPSAGGGVGSAETLAATALDTPQYPGIDASITPSSFYGDAETALAAYAKKRSSRDERQRAGGGMVAIVAGSASRTSATSGGSSAQVGANPTDNGAAGAPPKKRGRRHCQICFSATCPGHNKQSACVTLRSGTGGQARQAGQVWRAGPVTPVMLGGAAFWSSAALPSSDGTRTSPAASASPSPASSYPRLAPRPTPFRTPTLPPPASQLPPLASQLPPRGVSRTILPNLLPLSTTPALPGPWAGGWDGVGWGGGTRGASGRIRDARGGRGRDGAERRGGRGGGLGADRPPCDQPPERSGDSH